MSMHDEMALIVSREFRYECGRGDGDLRHRIGRLVHVSDLKEMFVRLWEEKDFAEEWCCDTGSPLDELSCLKRRLAKEDDKRKGAAVLLVSGSWNS